MTKRAPVDVARPRKLPRQERSAATVDAILEAAARVFAQRGYAPATTNRIAVAAGVSIGSLYEYFPNKEALLGALARRHMHEGLAAAQTYIAAAASGGALRDVVTFGIDAMIALHERDPALHRVIFEESPLPSTLRREIDAMIDPLIDGLAALLVASPEVSLPHPRLSARLVLQTIESLTHGYVLHAPPDVSREVFIGEAASLVLAYLVASRDAQLGTHDVSASARSKTHASSCDDTARFPDTPSDCPGEPLHAM